LRVKGVEKGVRKMRVMEVINHLIESDQILRHAVMHGEIKVVMDRNSFTALHIEPFGYTLVIWQSRIRKVGQTIRYMVYQARLDTDRIKEIYYEVMNKDCTYSNARVNLKKLAKRRAEKMRKIDYEELQNLFKI